MANNWMTIGTVVKCQWTAMVNQKSWSSIGTSGALFVDDWFHILSDTNRNTSISVTAYCNHCCIGRINHIQASAKGAQTQSHLVIWASCVPNPISMSTLNKSISVSAYCNLCCIGIMYHISASTKGCTKHIVSSCVIQPKVNICTKKIHQCCKIHTYCNRSIMTKCITSRLVQHSAQNPTRILIIRASCVPNPI